MIPEFMQDGNLPIEGHPHPATWHEFKERFCNGEHRSNMARKILELLKRAKHCKFRKVIMFGSFVTRREKPNDFDLIWLTEPDLDRDRLPAPCQELLDSAEAPKRFGCDVFYCSENPEMIKVLVSHEVGFGVDKNTLSPRGLVILDLVDDDLS